jgi:hypothetical protein
VSLTRADSRLVVRSLSFSAVELIVDILFKSCSSIGELSSPWFVGEFDRRRFLDLSDRCRDLAGDFEASLLLDRERFLLELILDQPYTLEKYKFH